MFDHLIDASMNARGQAWGRWGSVELVLSHLINPSFQGGPMWPAVTQQYLIARRGSEVLIASDGLSNPFTDDRFIGYRFRLEAIRISASFRSYPNRNPSVLPIIP